MKKKILVADHLLELTYIVPVYVQNESSTELADLIKTYDAYSRNITEKIQFIFVDDCSPVKPVLPPNNLNIVIARINQDIPWNQPGARNLGVMLAKTAKIILTDLDHVFPEILLEKILQSSLPRHLYKFKRKRQSVKVNAHPNTFYCSKGVFYKALGYDEAFCGHYGHDDTFYVALQKALGTKVRYFSRFIYLDHQENNNQEKTDLPHFLVRDTSHNKALLEEKLALIKNGEPWKAHSRKLLDFSYTIVDV